ECEPRRCGFMAAAGTEERWRLGWRVVDADGAAAGLAAVHPEVVSLRPHQARLALELVEVGVSRRSERMVHREPTPFVTVPFEQGKIGHPQEGKVVARNELVFLRDGQP